MSHTSKALIVGLIALLCCAAFGQVGQAPGVTGGSSAAGGAPAFSTVTSGTNNSAAMVVGTGATLVTTPSGQLAADTTWFPFAANDNVPSVPSLTAALTGGAIATGNTVYVRLTFVGPANIIPSPEVLIQMNATTGCGSASACTVTVTMPSNCTSPVAPVTGCTVWDAQNSVNIEKQQTASAACVNITAATCVIGTLATGALLSSVMNSTSGVNPPNLVATTQPDFIVPSLFMQKANGYYALAGIDTSALNLISCCWTANVVTNPTKAGTNAGTFTWTDRFFINDDVNPPPISNSLVSIKHESGTTTATLTNTGVGGVDDRALSIRIDNDLTPAPHYEQYLGQYNEMYVDNANSSCAPVSGGTPWGESCTAGGRFTGVDQRNGTGVNNMQIYGAVGVASVVGTTVQLGGATPSVAGVVGGAYVGTNNQNGGGNWWAGGFFGANAVSGMTNANGVGVYIKAPSVAWPSAQWGNYIEDFGSATAAFNIASVSATPATSGKNIFQGQVWLPKIVETNGTIPVTGSITLTGGISTAQLAAPTLSGIGTGGTPGSSTNTYKATCVDVNGAETTASAAASTVAGNANLTGTNFDIVQFTGAQPPAGCSTYNIYRTAAASTCNGSGCTNGKIGSTTLNGATVTGTQSIASFNDTGQVGDGNTAVAQPNATGGLAAVGIIGGSNTVRLTSDSSGITATTPGTTFLTLPNLSASKNYSFNCELLYSQATAVVLDGFSVQAATNAATRWDAWGSMYTLNPTTGAITGSQASALNVTTTTSTPVVTATPGAIGTVYQARLSGTIQVGATVPTVNIAAFTGNASDAITIKAGSFCEVTP